MTLEVISILIAVLSLAFALFGGKVRRDHWVSRRRKKTVLVYTRDEHTFRGILLEVGVDALVLKHAELISAAQPSMLAGEIVVPRANVSFLQDAPPQVDDGDRALRAIS